MFFVVFQLLFAAAVGLVDGQLHAFRNFVGIHDDHAVNIAGGTSGSLRQRTVGTEESLLVRIQNSNKGYFRQVQPFT